MSEVVVIAGDADNCDTNHNNHEEDHNSFHFHEKGEGGVEREGTILQDS